MGDGEFAPIEGNYVNVNGIKMYYEVYGEGYPLILIHGGISNVRMWDKQIPIFSKHFKCFVVDCRGQGKTNNPLGEFHYKLMADDIAAFIKELKLERPFLCGWSDGAQIGLEIGLNYSDLVKSMVLGGTLIHISQELIDGFKAIGIEGPGQVNFEKLEQTLDWLVKLLKKHQSSVYGENYWKSLLIKISQMWFDPEEFPGEAIKNITTPSLILLGDRDDYIPVTEAVTMHKIMPNAELTIIPNGNHDVYATQTELYNQIVINYLLRQIEKKIK